MQSIEADMFRIRHAAAQLSDAVLPQSVAGQPDAGGESFARTLMDAIHSVDGAQRTADARMTAVDSGDSDDLVGAMLASRQASLSFAMLTQVRNKVTTALDELLKMQL
ncbi:flagellar hook-basal body complex protein FliE [Burkholderia ubonensis]|uniref:flagellar hook-basal body complex protein FliE n=1 Tax=Burkholderia ubonensis TaxID=101571 RepID=UPI000752F310|nr:flagellar hook-basal body complex protein FliE [Burkholderia ubonensis]KWB79405.1 hypothetical protein WL42_12650 [Burkholderia ubonensis]